MKRARGANQSVPGPQGGMNEVDQMISQSMGLQELEQRAVHLRMKEDENKLSFNRTTGSKPPGMSSHNGN